MGPETPAQTRPVLVTGAGRGIGRGIALRLAAQGFPIAVTDRDSQTADAVAQEVRGAGGVAASAELDVTDTDSIRAALEIVVPALGCLGAVVNNAGWTRHVPLADHDDEHIAQLLEINLAGPIRICRETLPALLEFGSGRIVNIASDSARTGMSNGAAYTSAKGGVLALTRSLARELARHRITVNCVSPGIIDTPLFAETTAGTSTADKLLSSVPMRRLGQPEDIAGAVAYFLSPAADYVTGQTISVSGGLVII